MDEPLVILHEDAHCLAVAKPAGLPTQGPPGAGPTLEAAVRRHLRPDDPAAAYLGTVHRLDRPVSGVVLWAKTPRAARRLADAFARRAARKLYWALVASLPAPASGTWDDWLGPPGPDGRAPIGRGPAPGYRRAVTHYRVLGPAARGAGLTRLELRPETGRTHQLRAQASARGWPIVGDRTYGSARDFPAGIALHARALTVPHPSLGRPLLVEAPLPPSWAGPWGA